MERKLRYENFLFYFNLFTCCGWFSFQIGLKNLYCTYTH